MKRPLASPRRPPDRFESFWRPAFAAAGYGAVAASPRCRPDTAAAGGQAQRTPPSGGDGLPTFPSLKLTAASSAACVLFFRHARLQLLSSHDVQFDDLAAWFPRRASLRGHRCACVAALRPWNGFAFPTAILAGSGRPPPRHRDRGHAAHTWLCPACPVSAHLGPAAPEPASLTAQAYYLRTALQRINTTLSLPHVLCLAVDRPARRDHPAVADAEALLTAGRVWRNAARTAPKRLPPPCVKRVGLATVTLSIRPRSPPPVEWGGRGTDTVPEDLAYAVQRRELGRPLSRFALSRVVRPALGDDSAGKIDAEVADLACGCRYEFRVAAVRGGAMGPFSEPSCPVSIPRRIPDAVATTHEVRAASEAVSTAGWRHARKEEAEQAEAAVDEGVERTALPPYALNAWLEGTGPGMTCNGPRLRSAFPAAEGPRGVASPLLVDRDAFLVQRAEAEAGDTPGAPARGSLVSCTLRAATSALGSTWG